MAQKTLPTKQAFESFFTYVESLGFRRMTNLEIAEEIAVKTEVSSSIHKGKGQGFRRQYVLQVDTIRCEVNTNYSDALGTAYEGGYGSVVVKDSRNTTEKLFSFDVRLGEGYLRTLYKYARAFADFIHKWPFAHKGTSRLILSHIPKVMHEMYFVINRQKQEGIYFLDIALEKENREFLEEMFDRYANTKKREQGKKIYRKPLRVIRSEKLVSKE